MKTRFHFSDSWLLPLWSPESSRVGSNVFWGSCHSVICHACSKLNPLQTNPSITADGRSPGFWRNCCHSLNYLCYFSHPPFHLMTSWPMMKVGPITWSVPIPSPHLSPKNCLFLCCHGEVIWLHPHPTTNRHLSSLPAFCSCSLFLIELGFKQQGETAFLQSPRVQLSERKHFMAVSGIWGPVNW